MKHKCLKSSSTNWEHDTDPCVCECRYCIERSRLRALPELESEELEKLWEVCACDAAPGPWTANQLDGMGAMNFILSHNPTNAWYAVVAKLENAGNIDGANFIAWCHDGVPRLLKTIERLQQENEELQVRINDIGDEAMERDWKS
jgi:hypothetical protein